MKDSTAACPFCGAVPANPPLLGRIVTRKTVAGAVGIGLALSLCACYGPPPRGNAPPPDPAGQNAPEENRGPEEKAGPGYATPPPVEQPR